MITTRENAAVLVGYRNGDKKQQPMKKWPKWEKDQNQPMMTPFAEWRRYDKNKNLTVK